MSDIKIQPSATGSGTVTITAPTTNTARVITLPDSTATVATTTDVAARLSSIVDGGNATAITIDSSEKVGIGVTALTRQLAIGTLGTKTDTGTKYVMNIGQTTESSGHAGLGVYFVGHANAASRKWQFQPTENGVANDGIIEMNPNGGYFRANRGVLFNTDTAAANILDDYEEGTWTLTDQSGANMSLTVYVAMYTKIGRKVFFEIGMAFPTNSSTAIPRLSLPFTAKAGGDNTGAAFTSGTNSGREGDLWLVSRGQAYFQVGNHLNADTHSTQAKNNHYSGKQLKLCGSYTV